MKYDFSAAMRGQMSLVNTNGKLWMAPQACKDYIHDGMCHHFYPEKTKYRGITNMGLTGDLITNFPVFVLWTCSRRVNKNAKKFAWMINQIEERMGIPKEDWTITQTVDTGRANKSAPFIAKAPALWIKSPVGASAYMTFLRLAIAMRLNESLDDFLLRIVEETYVRTLPLKDKSYAIVRDAGYVKKAKKMGNLTGLIEQSSLCYNREGNSDYLLSTHMRGFSGYSQKEDKHHPTEESVLMANINAPTLPSDWN